MAARILRYISLNIYFLIARLAEGLIRLFPRRPLLVITIGRLYGLAAFVAGVRSWGRIAAFGRMTKSGLPSWRYVVNYFFQRGIDTVLEFVPDILAGHTEIKGLQALKDAAGRGRGVILIGMHYGPMLYGYLFRGMGIELRPFVSRQFVRVLRDGTEHVLPYLRSPQYRFWEEIRESLIPTRSERDVVRHVRSGGVVSMYIDFPIPRADGATVRFLGIPLRISLFPFRLSAAGSVPVFFYAFHRKGPGAYCLEILPAGDFTDPSEGARRYAAFMEEQVRSCPFMWRLTPYFSGWISGGRTVKKDQG